MKVNKIISYFSVVLIMLFTACDSIVDEEVLVNSTDIAGVELVATASTAGGNEITLNMVTPGVTGYWDYNLGKALTNELTVVYPIPGTSTFTFTGTLGAEFFEKTVDVQIDVLDHDLDQDWYDLVGTDTTVGKTWVFDGVGGDKGLWWFMSPGNNKERAWEVWWNSGGTCCPPVDVNGRMHFDLNGGANYTYYSYADATSELGSFILDVPGQMLQINNSNILGAQDPRGNPEGLYEIVSLTEDKLVLYMSHGGSGWTWVFKPEE